MPIDVGMTVRIFGAFGQVTALRGVAHFDYVWPMRTTLARPLVAALILVAFIASACSTETAATPTPTPTPLVIAEPTELPDQTPPTQVPTVTPVPATPTATAEPIVEPPTAVVADVFFQPITPDVGPWDYPTVGLDQIDDQLLAEAVWTIIEHHNATVRMAQNQSAEGIESWDRLVAGNRMVTEYADGYINADWSTETNRIGEQSVITEMSVSTDDKLRIFMCGHLELVDDGTSTFVTLELEHTFVFDQGLYKLAGYQQTPVSSSEFISCDL